MCIKHCFLHSYFKDVIPKYGYFTFFFSSNTKTLHFLQTTEFRQYLFHIRDDALFDYDTSCPDTDITTVLLYKTY